MSILIVKPTFGGRLNTPQYYSSVDSICRMLRPAATLRTIANHLNAAGFKTPSGLIWDRQRVANYLRNKSI